MKANKHEVITQGTPKLENMPKEVFNVFCTSLLAGIEEHYRRDSIGTAKKDRAIIEFSTCSENQ